MGDALKRRKFAASLAALALGLTLAGCGDTNDPEPDDAATSAEGGSSPASTETDGGSSDSASSSPDPSASGDWWPEQPEKMATGQEFPDDYEPATLEHPARNVPKPVMPEEAKQETEAGAQAFLDYYAYAGWYAYQTGDTSYMRDIVSPSCEICIEEMDLVDEIYANSDWAAGSDERNQIIPGTFPAATQDFYTIPVATRNGGAKLVSNNKVVREFLPFDEKDRYDVNIDFEENKWVYITASPRGQS